MLNLAAFYNDYTDIQLTSVHAVEGIIVAVTENAGKARIQGLELELAAQPVDPILIRPGWATPTRSTPSSIPAPP